MIINPGGLIRGRRLFLALALLPWPLVAIPLYGLHQYPLALLLYHGLCCGAWLAWGRRAAEPRAIDLRFWLRASAALAAGGVAAVWMVMDVGPLRSGVQFFGYAPAHLLPLAAYFLLVHPLAEELFWRATVYEGLRSEMGEAGAAGVSAFFFAAWHALVLWAVLPVLWPLATAVVAAFGLVMTALYVRAGRSVTVPTIVHAIGGDLPLVVVLGLAFIQ